MRGLRAAAGGPDRERHEILLPAGAQPRRVDAAWQPLGDLPLETGLPPGVLEVVVVEVDGAVLGGPRPEIRLSAAPVAACGGHASAG